MLKDIAQRLDAVHDSKMPMLVALALLRRRRFTVGGTRQRVSLQGAQHVCGACRGAARGF